MTSVRVKKRYGAIPNVERIAEEGPDGEDVVAPRRPLPRILSSMSRRASSATPLPTLSRPAAQAAENETSPTVGERSPKNDVGDYVKDSWLAESIQARPRRGTLPLTAVAPDMEGSQTTAAVSQAQTGRSRGGSVAATQALSDPSRRASNGSDGYATEEEEEESHYDGESDYTTDGSDIDEEEHHLDEVVDHLDVIDPEIAIISHLSNAANSILLPRLPVYSRRPVVNLPTATPTESMTSLATTTSRATADSEAGIIDGEKNSAEKKTHHHHHLMRRKKTHKEKNQSELDAHVEHVLKRKAKLRRASRGLWAFLKTPAGVVVGIYGFLVVFWGAAIVLFLVKAINLHNHDVQNFWIEVSSQCVNALFTLTGVGLIPWRLQDTYHILWIWYYKRLDEKLRLQQGLEPLKDVDDLPDPALDPNFLHVLTEQQSRRLRRHQKRFMKSQTWYRPHATDTHRAFSIKTALIICLFVDFNSIFQCFLCGCMWGLNRFQRPAWTTGLLIPASFLCGIAAAVYIARGGNQSKKVDEVEARLKAALQARQNAKKSGGRGATTKENGDTVVAMPTTRRQGLVTLVPMAEDRVREDTQE